MVPSLSPLTIPTHTPTSDPNLPIQVLTKDLTINQSNNTWLRLFLPRKALDHPSINSKLPLIVYFHGGGFTYYSAASTVVHDFCSKIANDVQAVVASVDYRLAPEHRLPAAYDDAVEALHWIKTCPDDDWFREFVDYSSCYLMGNSAGATIAHYAGLRVAEKGHQDLKPMKIQGLILRQPFFGGTRRTDSEMRLEKNPVLLMCVCDLLW